MADDRLIVALDVPNVVQGLELAARLGDAVSFYKIGLGMLTGGGFALANELKQEQGKKVFLDMKLFDIGAAARLFFSLLARSPRALARFVLVREQIFYLGNRSLSIIGVSGLFVGFVLMFLQSLTYLIRDIAIIRGEEI